jgi:hypothetical protein
MPVIRAIRVRNRYVAQLLVKRRLSAQFVVQSRVHMVDGFEYA